ncbi:DUF2141 domain-containing protein [Litorilituus lipolyticus]|nr:DUF2141 domain-containing protein [Litorilituus lipolyticus]
MIVLSIFLYLPIAFFTKIQAKDETALVVHVERIKRIEGTLFYQLFECPESELVTWSDLRLIYANKTAVIDNNIIITLPHSAVKSVPDENGNRVAFRVFQDIDNDGVLAFSNGDIPKEPTGFSNNPSLILGMPKPVDTCFEYDSIRNVKVKLNNKRKRGKRK